MEWWQAQSLRQLDFDPRTVEESRLVSIIKALGGREVKPRLYYELRAIAIDRGVNLEDPYGEEKIPEDAAQKRLKAIHGIDDTTPLNERVVTAGRRNIDDLIAKSGLFSGEDLTHTPFLVFHDQGSHMHIMVIPNSNKLLEFPDETKVMVQWKGKWSSDYFQFTVGEVRARIGFEKTGEPSLFDDVIGIRRSSSD